MRRPKWDIAVGAAAEEDLWTGAAGAGLKGGAPLMTSTTSNQPVSAATVEPRASVQDFLVAHLVLLMVVLIGFGPTFYLRAFFDQHPLPAILLVHGTVLTGWFVLTVLQAWLMHTGQIRWHRRIGYFAAGYAALVVTMGAFADARMAGEIHSPQDGDLIVVWGNFFSLVLFAAFVTFAVLLRKAPETHKRLILLASISIIGPAAARFTEWPIFPGGMEARPLYGVGGLLLFYGALITYDVIVRRRPHAASWIGLLAMIVSSAITIFLMVSGKGFEILHPGAHV